MRLEDLTCINQNVNLGEYIEFREMVKEHMEHPEWLGDFTKDELKDCLSHGSIIWVYYYNDDPVCSMMMIPSSEKSLKNLLLNEYDHNDVVDYGPMFVNPKYVGNGLQYQMLQAIDNYCINLGYKYAAGTIHPDNIYSIRNLLKDNFDLTGTKEFTRGLRNIYLKKY